jgi:hypothetical protein
MIVEVLPGVFHWELSQEEFDALEKRVAMLEKHLSNGETTEETIARLIANADCYDAARSGD